MATEVEFLNKMANLRDAARALDPELSQWTDPQQPLVRKAHRQKIIAAAPKPRGPLGRRHPGSTGPLPQGSPLPDLTPIQEENQRVVARFRARIEIKTKDLATWVCRFVTACEDGPYRDNDLLELRGRVVEHWNILSGLLEELNPPLKETNAGERYTSALKAIGSLVNVFLAVPEEYTARMPDGTKKVLRSAASRAPIKVC